MPAEAVGFNPRPTVHDLRHCWYTNSVRSDVHPAVADALLGHGDKRKSLQTLYLTLSDDDPIQVIDMMKLDINETEIWVQG